MQQDLENDGIPAGPESPPDASTLDVTPPMLTPDMLAALPSHDQSIAPPPPDVGTLPPVDCLSADELAYLRGAVKASEQALKDFQVADIALTKAKGAQESYTAHLFAKYGRDARINLQTGTIARTPTEG